MEKITTLSKLGIKYLYRYKKRYGFLFAALIFGFAVVTYITSSKDGMYNNVYYSAQSHYAGDIVAVGYNHDIDINHLSQQEITAVLNAVNESGIAPRHTVLRTTYMDRGIIYFHGNAVLQKYIIGSDWEAEEYIFSKMNFAMPAHSEIGDDGIIISEAVAGELGAVMGDSVILEVDTRWGQKNTGVFIIRGIIQDSSLFGYYKVYISRLVLNRLLLFEDGDCSSVGFFLNSPSSARKKRIQLQNILENKIQTGALVYNREELRTETDAEWEGNKVFLLTLPVYLSEVYDLLGAINIVTYFLYGLMLIIILVSIAVTYRLILHERAIEMGVMRAIGFFGSDLRFVLWIEIIALGVISVFSGFLLAWILSRAATLLSFSWFPSFEIFLKDGSLSVLYLPGTVFFNVLLIFIILVTAVLLPSFRVSKKHLPSLLSGESL
jgi:ABC-type lipoprotein release transport system permease subunit